MSVRFLLTALSVLATIALALALLMEASYYLEGGTSRDEAPR